MPEQNSPSPFPKVPARDPYRERIDPKDQVVTRITAPADANQQPAAQEPQKPIVEREVTSLPQAAEDQSAQTAPIQPQSPAPQAARSAPPANLPVEPTEAPAVAQASPLPAANPASVTQPGAQAAPTIATPPVASSTIPTLQPLPSVRTYAGDAAQALRSQEATQATIAIAEADKNNQGRLEIKTSSNRPRRHTWLSVSVILILIAATSGLLGYIWFIAPAKGPLAGFTPPPEVIIADSESRIDVSSLRDEALRGKLSDTISSLDLSPKSVETIYLTQGSGSLTHAITAADFLRLIDAQAPATLVRTFGDRFAFGVQNIADHNEPFLVFTIDSFDTAFAGMLDWEKTLSSDLSFLTGTSTIAATFDQATSTDGFSHSDFRDAVIQNNDVRFLPAPGDVAKGGDGVRLLYAFPNRTTLIITTSNTSFEHLLEHLNREQPAE